MKIILLLLLKNRFEFVSSFVFVSFSFHFRLAFVSRSLSLSVLDFLYSLLLTFYILYFFPPYTIYQVVLIFVGTTLLGAIHGLMFGIIDVENDDAKYVPLFIRKVNDSISISTYFKKKVRQ